MTKLLESENSAEVRESIYDALDLQDNLDFTAIQTQVIQEESSSAFMMGALAIIHDRRLNDLPQDTIDPQIVTRLKKLAEDPKNKIAVQQAQHFD